LASDINEAVRKDPGQSILFLRVLRELAITRFTRFGGLIATLRQFVLLKLIRKADNGLSVERHRQLDVVRRLALSVIPQTNGSYPEKCPSSPTV
jgi:hypothetical protein